MSAKIPCLVSRFLLGSSIIWGGGRSAPKKEFDICRIYQNTTYDHFFKSNNLE